MAPEVLARTTLPPRPRHRRRIFGLPLACGVLGLFLEGLGFFGAWIGDTSRPPWDTFVRVGGCLSALGLLGALLLVPALLVRRRSRDAFIAVIGLPFCLLGIWISHVLTGMW